jgi:hypothetical protein
MFPITAPVTEEWLHAKSSFTVQTELFWLLVLCARDLKLADICLVLIARVTVVVLFHRNSVMNSDGSIQNCGLAF